MNRGAYRWAKVLNKVIKFQKVRPQRATEPFFFFFKLYIIVLVLPNIKMNPPQVYMCSPS